MVCNAIHVNVCCVADTLFKFIGSIEIWIAMACSLLFALRSLFQCYRVRNQKYASPLTCLGGLHLHEPPLALAHTVVGSGGRTWVHNMGWIWNWSRSSINRFSMQRSRSSFGRHWPRHCRDPYTAVPARHRPLRCTLGAKKPNHNRVISINLTNVYNLITIGPNLISNINQNGNVANPIWRVT